MRLMCAGSTTDGSISSGTLRAGNAADVEHAILPRMLRISLTVSLLLLVAGFGLWCTAEGAH